LIVTGGTRAEALENTKKALASFEIAGIETNIPFLQFLINQPEFIKGNIYTKWIETTVLPQFLETVKANK